MRKAEIKYNNQKAGTLIQDDAGYHYSYDRDYLRSENPQPISVNLPLQEQSFESKILFPFFDGLIPEGWLLKIAISEKNWKLNARDRMGLLLVCCEDCIGAVSVHATNNEEI
jgi:serine/threonine-protein kinase HipA